MPNVEPLRPGDPPSLGAYRILGWLASGGQGVVYLGQAPDGRRVAVKVLHGVVAGDRFAALTGAARRVEPSGVAPVMDAAWGRLSYIVSEYVEGPSLAEAGRLGGGHLRHLAIATATGVAAVHRAGFAHGDFKPSSVLLAHDGARVVGFGAAGTGPGSGRAGAGTGPGHGDEGGAVAYMAPEQLPSATPGPSAVPGPGPGGRSQGGAAVGPAADVFAWASVMVFAATGRPPFGDDSPPAVAGRILRGEPQLADVPDPLRPILRACFAKDPSARPAMRDVLTLLRGHSPAPAPGVRPQRGDEPRQENGPLPGDRPLQGGGTPEGLPGAPGRAGRRVPLAAVAVAGVVAVGLAAGVVVWNSGKRQADAAAVRAVRDGTPSASAEPSGRGASRARTSRTPQGRAARPRLTPTPARTDEAQAPDATPTPSGTPTPTARAAFRLAYVRVQGSSKINSAGVTCYTGSVNFAAGVDATRPGAAYTYQWLYDGRVIESGTSRLPAGSRSDYVTSKRVFTPGDGAHTVTYRVTAPSARTRSARFTMCPTAP